MKVILVSPPGTVAEKLYTMSEVGGIASVLQQAEFKVELLDCNGSLDDLQTLQTMKDDNLMFISLILQWENCLYNRWIWQFMGYAKDNFGAVHLNCEGRAATVFYRELLKKTPSDSVIRGEGEETILELCSKLKAGRGYKEIAGIAYKEDGQIKVNPKRDAISNLDSLPLPFRGYLIDHRKYPIVPLYTSRSCYGKCAFCFGRIYRNANKTASPFRVMSTEIVVQEITRIVKNYDAKRFYFVDDNFIPDHTLGVKRAKQIAQLILDNELEIRFSIECRANDIEVNLFSLLKKAGLRKVFVGFESGSNSVLKRYEKGTTVEINLRAVEILRQLDIDIDVGFIMFDPWTTFQELEENLLFLEKTQLHKCKSRISVFNSLSICPDSEVEKLYRRKGKHLDKRLSMAKSMIKYAESLIYKKGIYAKGRKLPVMSAFFEDKKREILFRVFQESVKYIRQTNQIEEKESEEIRNMVECDVNLSLGTLCN